MVHDPLSALFNKTFEDSILLPLPQTDRGTLPGHLILHKRGDYGYKGEITLDGGILKVHLFYNDTDYGSNSPVSWNGEYQLIRQ
ncbi:hypothetical protein GCM10027175_36140 [Hymenobacter latericoloratus]